MAYRILVATYTDRVETLLFDSETKSLSVASSLTVGYHPSWIIPHPENKAIWFTVLEQEDGRVVAIEYDKEGKGKIVGDVSSEGADPCTLESYRGELFVGNVSLSPPKFSTADTHRRLLWMHWYLLCTHRGSTPHIVWKRTRRRVPLNLFPTLCWAVHHDAHP